MSQIIVGVAAYRRPVSKRLVFYDFELADSTVKVELVLKVGALAVDDIKLLRDTIKLGDTLRVTGSWQQPRQQVGKQQVQHEEAAGLTLEQQHHHHQQQQQQQQQHLSDDHQHHQQQQRQPQEEGAQPLASTQQQPCQPVHHQQDQHPGQQQHHNQQHREFLATRIQILRRWQDDHPHTHFIPRPSTAPQQGGPKQPPPAAATPQCITTLAQPSRASPPQPAAPHAQPSTTCSSGPFNRSATASTTTSATPNVQPTDRSPTAESTAAAACTHLDAGTQPAGHSNGMTAASAAPPPPPSPNCGPSSTSPAPSNTSPAPPHPASTAPSATDPYSAPAASESTNPAPMHPTSMSASPAEPSGTQPSSTDPLLGTCKFWVNTLSCSRGAFCPYAHPAGPDRPQVRRQWERSRDQARVRRAREAGLHRDDSASTKAARARVFAEWLVGAVGREVLAAGSGVLDVAGGRGAVSFELATKYSLPTLLVEPRPAKLTKAQMRRLPAATGPVAPRDPAAESQAAVAEAPGAAGDVHDGEAPPDVPALPEAAVAAAAPAEATVAPANTPSGPGGGLAAVADGGGSGSRSSSCTGGVAAALGPPAAEGAAGTPGWRLPQLRELFGPEMWRQGPQQEQLQACSMVVGMHPDEATEAILEFALECGKPFAIVPCCVFPRQFPHRRLRLEGGGEEPVESYQQLVAYLAQRGGGQTAHLGFQGANCVVFRLPAAAP